MNRASLSLLFTFVVLVLSQIFLFNQLHLLGSINPLVYVYFFIHHRLDANQTQFIALSFALGFLLDLLTQGAGGHTISAITVAFLRPRIIALNFSVVLQEATPQWDQIPFLKQFLFSVWMVFIHHLVYFLVLFFSFSSLFIVFKQTFLTGIFTLTFLWVVQLLFKSKK